MDSGGLSALVGLDAFVVRAQFPYGDQWWFSVETTAAVVGYEAWGVRAVGHGWRRVTVRDLPIAGEPTTLM